MNFKIVVCLCFTIVDINGSHLQPRIIGGNNAIIQDYPYQISMRWTYGVAKPKHFCGGSIIDEYHVVTAAHCVDNKNKQRLMKYVKIYTGTSRSDSLGTGNAYDVEDIKIHPDYRGASTLYHNDIAIVTLKEAIKFDEYQKPVKLPTKDVKNGAKATITGWGNTKYSSRETPLQLQKASMRLITSKQCQSHVPFILKNTQVCAFQRGGVGVCSGDSGSPLVVNGELAGLASYVMKCAKGHPDIYTNVYQFVDFIKQTINTSN